MDDRCMTIEIQSENNYDLSGNLLAIIAPRFYQNDRDFLKLISISGAKPHYYKYYDRHRVNEYVGDVFTRVEEYYIDNDYIVG